MQLLNAKFKGGAADNLLHVAVAQSNWNMARAANKPWGAGAATSTHSYSLVSATEKVRAFENTIVSAVLVGKVVFFFSIL